MAGESEPRSQLGDGASASPPTSIREKIQPGHAERAEAAAGTTVVAPNQGAADPEKAVHSHGSFQGDIPPTTALSTASGSLEITAAPTSPGDSGREDNEYISGPKLYVALFSIISVFFLVLLDFSILSTVSTDNPQNYSVPSILDGNNKAMLPRWLTTLPRLRHSGYSVHHK